MSAIIQFLNCLGDSALTCFLYLATMASHDSTSAVLTFTFILNISSHLLYNFQVFVRSYFVSYSSFTIKEYGGRNGPG